MSNNLNLIQHLQQEIKLRDEIIESLEGRSTASKSIILTGDMHVGHDFALGGELQDINEFWMSARDRLLRKRANVFVINGEPIEGDNVKELGHGLWTTDLAEQMGVANAYLQCYKMDKVGMTRGSNYHTTKGNTSFEQLFADMITCAPVIDYAMFGGIQTTLKKEYDAKWSHIKTRIDDLLALRVNGVVFNIIHHVGGTRWFAYVPTAIAREMAQMIFIDGKLWEQQDSPTVIVRAHTHHYVQVKYGRTAGFVTPAWKVIDRFQLKRGIDAATIGLIEVLVEQNGDFTINDIIMGNKSYPKINIIDI